MMEAITPYITFNGYTKEAFSFYAQALHGEILVLQTYGDVNMAESEEDKNRIMHAVLKAGALTLMASDNKCADTQVKSSSMVSLSLNFTNEKEIEKTFHALSEGAVISMPLQDTFWNARFGILTDKFGIQWMFNYDKPQEV